MSVDHRASAIHGTGGPTLIVGAGPTGLTAALALKAAGHRAVVIEAEPEDRVRAGSRALYLHARSLEILRALDPALVDDMKGLGLTWRTRKTTYRGRVVFEHTHASRPTDRVPFLSLRQSDTETFLLRACSRAGVTFVFNAPIVSVQGDDQGVKVRAVDGRTWRGAYLIGADGAHSAVRRSVGLRMHGRRAKGFHVVVDVAEHRSQPATPMRTFHYEHPALDGRNVLTIPFGGGWQVDLQCRETDKTTDFTSPEGLAHWLPKVLPQTYLDRLQWVSTYQFLQVVANEMIDTTRRILLAGEAAHLFAPFGARGMNSGIADAAAAAQAIIKAGSADTESSRRGAIEAFANIRLAAAHRHRKAAASALRRMQTPDPLARLERSAAAALAPRFAALGQWLEEAPYGPKLRPGAGY